MYPLLALILAAASGCHHESPVNPDQNTGVLEIIVGGLPDGAGADVRVDGPHGFSRIITASAMIAAASPGRYTVRANQVRNAGFTYAAVVSQVDTTLPPGDTIRLQLRYEVITGALAVRIRGLPGGVAASVRISGSGLSRVANSNVVLGDLPPGTYTVTIDSLNAGGTAFAGVGVSQVVIQASTEPTTLDVQFATVMASLILTPTGLPSGDPTASPGPSSGASPGSSTTARVQGPLQIDRMVPLGGKLLLPVGSYTITPSPVTIGSRFYTPVSRIVTRTLTSTAPDTFSVAYQEITTPINITIDNVVVTQAVQRRDNGIPLIAGKDALLRAFIRSDRRTSSRPLARARLFDGSSALAVLLLTPPDSGVPTVPLDEVLASTYRTRIPGNLIRPQLRIAVEVDPDSTLGEVQRNDNFWPAGAASRALTITQVPPFAVRFIPVRVDGVTGDISAQTMDRYLAVARNLWPLSEVSAEMRGTFVSSAGPLQSNDANGAWSILLSELRALRMLEAAPVGTHYYGVVHPPYTEGTFGLGVIGAPVAVGWDRGDVAATAAHEWGHNFGRLHAPCGNPPEVDASYPNIGASIGLTGWNAETDVSMPASAPDIMSYCTPAWISEYSYSYALTFRQNVSPASVMALPSVRKLAAPVDTGLLVWGRVANGNLIVEPAFGVMAPFSAPALQPTHTVELLDASGEVIGHHALRIEPVDHGHVNDGTFAVVIPLSGNRVGMLSAVRVRDVRSPLVAVTRHRERSAQLAVIQERNGSIGGFVRRNHATGGSVGADTAQETLIWSDGVSSTLVRTK